MTNACKIFNGTPEESQNGKHSHIWDDNYKTNLET
jgi:hypothetical protein